MMAGRLRMLLAGGAFLACAFSPAAEGADIAVRTMKVSFEEARERVVLAIENRGMVIDHTSKIGEMLARTGKDIGRPKRVYCRAELIEFCSARLSRDMMEADARNIVLCPFGIAVYTLPGEPGLTHIAYRTLAPSAAVKSAKALAAIDRLLAAIVEEAAQ